jgi:cyclophilin family peptidyl-prolyl cis-trans isomerase
MLGAPLNYPYFNNMKWLSILVLLTATIFAKSAWAEEEPPFELPPRPELLKIRSAILDTSRGRIFLELFPEEAPWHVANFKYLADKGFYRGLSFHLFKAGYLIQGGDPKGTGYGGPGYSLLPEFSSREHRAGILGMARVSDGYSSQGRPLNPERRSSGSQFHLLLADSPHMDGQYTVFGKVVGGNRILEMLRQGDIIEDLRVFIREGGR